MVRWGLRLLLLLVALVVLLGIAAAIALQGAKRDPVTIDFTRHLSSHGAADANSSESFVAQSGAGRLLVQCDDLAPSLTVTLNGAPALAGNQTLRCDTPFEVEVSLAQRNTIEVVAVGAPGSSATVRVKQAATVDLHVLSRVHFNANVSDFEASRAFYGALGFATLSGFPDTNTQAMARAIGIETPTSYDGSQGDHAGGYLLHGELIGLGFLGGVIDLIEFSIPRDESPPYARVNRLGMAYGVMVSTDLDGDYARMLAAGVTFVAPPVARANGVRFAVFSDPDGVLYELREAADSTSTANDAAMQIVSLGPLGVNVSDFERSRAWYQMFGYELTRPLEQRQPAAVSRAMGFAGEVVQRGAVLTHNVDGSTMELIQWLQPFDPRPPYPIPVNHLGIHRTALATTDIAADVATLKAQGVEFVSPTTPCCSGPDSSGSIVAFYDPDGTIVELVEQPAMTWLTPLMLWARSVF